MGTGSAAAKRAAISSAESCLPASTKDSVFAGIGLAGVTGFSFFFSFFGAGSAALKRAAISSAERLLFGSLSALLPAEEETDEGSFTVSRLVLSTAVKGSFLISGSGSEVWIFIKYCVH